MTPRLIEGPALLGRSCLAPSQSLASRHADLTREVACQRRTSHSQNPSTQPTEGATAMSTTDVVLEKLRGEKLDVEARALKAAIKAAVAQKATGWLNSHAVADLFFDARLRAGRREVSWDQTKDYVQHLLREVEHVCRHADGHDYLLHHDEVCGEGCTARYQRNTPQRPLTELCPGCSTRLPVLGECGICN